jgi:hypothetical protein
MNDNRSQGRLPLAILVTALVAWTAMLALGAYLQLGGDQPRHDLRKPLVILASIGIFLAVWGIAVTSNFHRLINSEHSLSATTSSSRYRGSQAFGSWRGRSSRTQPERREAKCLSGVGTNLLRKLD